MTFYMENMQEWLTSIHQPHHLKEDNETKEGNLFTFTAVPLSTEALLSVMDCGMLLFWKLPKHRNITSVTGRPDRNFLHWGACACAFVCASVCVRESLIYLTATDGCP